MGASKQYPVTDWHNYDNTADETDSTERYKRRNKHQFKKVSKKRAQQIRRENKLRELALERCGGLCEKCGNPPDWRGLSLSHTKPKGMGGTTHKYTIDEVQMLCGKCHSLEHHLKEK
jgi:Zn finger protein HypA/HybF involved in hydrogenase expression